MLLQPAGEDREQLAGRRLAVVLTGHDEDPPQVAALDLAAGGRDGERRLDLLPHRVRGDGDLRDVSGRHRGRADGRAASAEVGGELDLPGAVGCVLDGHEHGDGEVRVHALDELRLQDELERFTGSGVAIGALATVAAAGHGERRRDRDHEDARPRTRASGHGLHDASQPIGPMMGRRNEPLLAC